MYILPNNEQVLKKDIYTCICYTGTQYYVFVILAQWFDFL